MKKHKKHKLLYWIGIIILVTVIADVITIIANNLQPILIVISVVGALVIVAVVCITIFKRKHNESKDDKVIHVSHTEHNVTSKEYRDEIMRMKRQQYYDYINGVIDYANDRIEHLFLKNSKEQLNNLIQTLYNDAISPISKIKTIDSNEWNFIKKVIDQIDNEIKALVHKNERVLKYYDSNEFLQIKDTCKALMDSQREFNEYIKEKVDSISELFSTRVVRNETINEDTYHYIRPYKKIISPFIAEVSTAVFASAENNPIDYVIRCFYQDKEDYPEQIKKLKLLIEELETLKDAKLIIDRYKAEYKQYLENVPDFIMREDEAGFYSRLGFANIDDSVLVPEYTFSYTSNGGYVKRTFPVPMTEENIGVLIKKLEEKLTNTAFTKEQRALMTNKLREYIKKRDNYTCRCCGNSIYKEKNLLLEIDHKIPISKGGCTTENNLQTLCWKCNRTKSNKYPKF